LIVEFEVLFEESGLQALGIEKQFFNVRSSMQVKRAQNGSAVLAKPTAAMLLLARYN
jgi:Holliday junction resolvasome RuvABC endonuclease subunit